nr:PREDICTED: lysosome-associated membrane glycoprotein 1-like [Bemisia tabaci]
MNCKVSLLLLVGLLCYVKSADSVDEAIPAGVSNKEELHLLKDSANKDIATSTSLPGGSNVVKPDEKGDWVLNYTSSATCIRLVAEIKIKVGYIRSKNDSGDSEITIPKKAIASGDCSTGTLILSWPSNGTGQKKNESIQFTFSDDSGSHIWRIANISGLVNLPIPSKTQKTHQNVPLSFYNNVTCFFNSHVGMSYKCLKSNSYDLSYDATNRKDLNFTSAHVIFSQLQVEAFKRNETDNLAFGSPTNCEVTPDMVPIAVGCALAGLVVIVLVAYLVSQRTAPAQGYRSV